MIQELIKGHVDNMTANGDSFAFLHSERDWQNLKADEIVFPAVFMDMPIMFKPTINNGAISREYILVLVFLYKSELDDNEVQRYATYQKAEQAHGELILALENDEEIKSINYGQAYQIPNYLDVNLDGIVQPLRIKPRLIQTYCPPENA